MPKINNVVCYIDLYGSNKFLLNNNQTQRLLFVFRPLGNRLLLLEGQVSVSFFLLNKIYNNLIFHSLLLFLCYIAETH